MAMGADRGANVEKAFAMARKARESGAKRIAFPGLSAGASFGKSPAAERSNAWAEPVPGGPLSRRLAALAAELEAVIVGSIFEYVPDGFYFNTAVVFERDGSFLGRSR